MKKILLVLLIILSLAVNAPAAVLLDAGNENVSIATNAKWTFTPVTQTRTISMFYRSSSFPNATGEYQIISFFYDDSGNRLQLLCAYSSGVVNLAVAVANSGWTTIGYFGAVVSLSTDTWYHLTFVLSSAGNNKIYVNNTAQTIAIEVGWSGATATEIVPDAVAISNGSAISDNFQIAHYAVFSDELTSTEIARLGATPYSMDDDPNILCSLHLDEQTGTLANDSQIISTKTNGTLVNSATWTTTPNYPILPGSTPVLDNFNRTDANSLGSNWSRGYADALGIFGINTNQMDVYSQVSGYTQAYWNVSTFGPECESRIKVSDWGDNLARINLSIKLTNPDSTSTTSGYTATFFGSSHASYPNMCCLKYVASSVSYTIPSEPLGDVLLRVNPADGDQYAVTYEDGVLYAWHYPASTSTWYISRSTYDVQFESQTGYNVFYSNAASGGADILLDDFGGGNIPYTASTPIPVFQHHYRLLKGR